MLEGDGRGQGVPGEGVAVVEGARPEVLAQEGVVDVAARHRGRHGQVAAGEALAQAEQVGADAAPLAGEQPAGAAEAGGHLVGDEQHAGPAAGVGQAGHLGRGR